MFISSMWDVKEPTHYSKRAGREVSRCCGCSSCCFFWVGASHRDNLIDLSPLDRDVQEKWLCYAKKEHKTSVNLVKLSIVSVNRDKYKAHWFLLFPLIYFCQSKRSAWLVVIDCEIKNQSRISQAKIGLVLSRFFQLRMFRSPMVACHRKVCV